MLHLQNLSENGNNSVHGMTTLNSAKEDKANEEFFQNVTTNQKHLNKLYDVETYTFEQMKSILEETANSVNEKTEEIISLNNEKLKKFDELSDESTSENEEIFVMEDIEVKNNRKVIIPKLQLGRIKKISDPVISTDDDSLFDGSSTDCQNTTDDDLEDLLGTPLKLRNSADEDLNNKSEEISHSESRWLIFHELLQTERSYVQTLQILMEMYIVPSKSCLSVSAFNSIFGEIEMILGVNKTFLEKLEEFEEIKSQEEKELKLSDLLKNYFITFKLYVKYISNYNSAQVHLRNSILKNSKFHRFLQTVRTELISKKYRMQTLNSYLISPIQRLPRYELLCKDLVYHSTKDTQLHQNLSQALQLIQYVAKYCNEKSGEIEADLRMRFLKKYLKIKDLISSHRRIIKELKMKRIKKNGKEVSCELFLFSDFMICAQKNIIGSLDTIKFDLNQISIKKSKTVKNSFIIEKTTSKQNIHLVCNTSKQFENLINEIEILIKQNCLP